MTKKPRKAKTIEPRASNIPRSAPNVPRSGSNTLRNRAIIAAVLMAGLGVSVWHPWKPADRAENKVVAALAPPAEPAPRPLAKPALAPAPIPVPAPSPAYTTASVSSAIVTPPLPPTPPQPARMSATLEADFDAWLIDAYKACYSPPPATPEGDLYLPRVRVAFKADGTLAGSPRLVNPPSDPAWRAHADAAIKAVKSCDPLHVPDKYAPYYSQWKTKTVFFDPTRS